MSAEILNKSSHKKRSAGISKANRHSTRAVAHPPVGQMVNAAIVALGEPYGSSLAAIKKHINATYKADIGKIAPFIRRYIRNAVAMGKLTQTKGTGATGSFKIAEKDTRTIIPRVLSATSRRNSPKRAVVRRDDFKKQKGKKMIVPKRSAGGGGPFIRAPKGVQQQVPKPRSRRSRNENEMR